MASALRSAYVAVSGLSILGAASMAMAVVRVVRPKEGRRICQEVIGGWAGETILKVLGIDLQVHRGDWPKGPCFYMSNHSSALDMPVLMAVRPPNARTFMKERFRWYGPLGLVTMLTGTLYTAPQEEHDRRVERFKQAEALLRRTGESVFGSPEGTRVTGGDFGPFNRGVFHIATNLKMPIVPMIILIPEETASGTGVQVNSGEIHVHVGEPIATDDWTEDDVDANKEAVRDHFVAWKKELLNA